MRLGAKMMKLMVLSGTLLPKISDPSPSTTPQDVDIVLLHAESQGMM